MKFKVIYSKRGQKELDVIIDWYINISLEIVKKFDWIFQGKIDNICHNPYAYKQLNDRLREAYLKEFPYLVIFFIVNSRKEVVIFSVFHTSQHPNKKLKT